MTDTASTVLIVEDQEGLAEAYQTVVATQYETRLATSGEQALELIDDTVDVVLLDRRMPGMSGDEVLTAFVERGVSAKIAMLTAVEPEAEIIEMAVDDYVSKPIDNDELLSLVEDLQKRSEYGEQIQQFCRLTAKRLALETANKEGTPEYERLVAKIAELSEEIDAELGDLRDELSSRQRA
jgi:DNA-binding response OmpR family regulator